MNKKWTTHIITLGALIVFIILGLACGSEEPARITIPTPDSFPNAQDINFVGEWRLSKEGNTYYEIYNADGTGISGTIYNDGAKSTNEFQWRTNAGCILFTRNDGRQGSLRYSFINNYRTVCLEFFYQGKLMQTDYYSKL